MVSFNGVSQEKLISEGRFFSGDLWATSALSLHELIAMYRYGSSGPRTIYYIRVDDLTL